MYSHIKYIKLSKLQQNTELSVVLIRLMMACNDISLSNKCLADFMDKNKESKTNYHTAASMYFVRLQVGHIEEGLRIIGEIMKNNNLFLRTNILSKDAKKHFDKLCACLDGRDPKWNRYFVPIRHNLSFHYNHKNGSKLISKALEERIDKKKQDKSKLEITDIHKMRFNLGDEIVDTIICRYIFGIPYDVDFSKDRKELDDILSYGSQIGLSLVTFSLEYIYKNT